jgi:hypothetical protein
MKLPVSKTAPEYCVGYTEYKAHKALASIEVMRLQGHKQRKGIHYNSPTYTDKTWQELSENILWKLCFAKCWPATAAPSNQFPENPTQSKQNYPTKQQGTLTFKVLCCNIRESTRHATISISKPTTICSCPWAMCTERARDLKLASISLIQALTKTRRTQVPHPHQYHN